MIYDLGMEEKMEPLEGFEPPAYGLRNRRSFAALAPCPGAAAELQWHEFPQQAHLI